ncbi:MAG: hypothetical protein ACLFWL_02735 [Candidatus Brocadiia bacterium]
MNIEQKLGVILGIAAFFTLGLQLPAVANPGYKPFEPFERTETKDYWIQVEAGPVSSNLDGSFLLNRDKGDTDVDLSGALNLSDDRNGRARIQLQFPLTDSTVRLGYYGIEYEETTQLDTDITVDGETFSASDQIDSLLRMDTYEVGFKQDIISTDMVSIAAMLQVNAVDFKARIDNETTGETVTEKAWIPIPYPGLRAEFFPIPWIGVYGEARGMTGSCSGVEFDSSDLEAGLQLNLNPNYDVRVGYRRFNYGVSFDETELDLTSDGPYAVIALRF